MSLQIMRLLLIVGLLQLTVIPSCRSESRVNPLFGSRVAPECRPGEEYRLPHDEYCEMYYECEDQEVATEKTCEPAFMYHCQREVCFPVSVETDISEVCCTGLVTRDPLPETTASIPTVSTITPPTSSGQTSTGTPSGSTSTGTSSDSTSTGTSSDSTSTGTSSDSTSTGTSPVTEIPVECPPSGQHLLPNPDDCSKYTKCVGGKPTFQECPGCNLFDIIRLQCVGYNSAKCSNGTSIPPYDPAVCSGCILSNRSLLTVTFILIITFVNKNNLLV